MSSVRRIKNLIFGILMLIGSYVILRNPEEGYYFVVLVLDITFLAYGINMLVYYLTMARFMTGGIMTLYKSIIAIDFGLFIFNLDETPKRLVMVYLIGVMAFNSVVTILNALDAKKLEVSSWKSKLVYGIVKLILAITCLIFWNFGQMVIWVYCVGLIHSAVYNIVAAFRKTAIIHIE